MAHLDLDCGTVRGPLRVDHRRTIREKAPKLACLAMCRPRGQCEVEVAVQNAQDVRQCLQTEGESFKSSGQQGLCAGCGVCGTCR